jgi:uncharacterized membrane protein YoaK (UPF0700 family)
MKSFLVDVRNTLVPGHDTKHGPLPPLLVIMTLTTGLVDAFSYLTLGHVFVANMTGNIVFLGFALAGAHGFSITASLGAIAAFIVGAAFGGRLNSLFARHRGRLLSVTTFIQAWFFGASVVLAVLAPRLVSGGYRYSLIGVLGIAMGLQNAVARKLAVPDLTTTVLTLTITGIAADQTVEGGQGPKFGRRGVAISSMFIGGLIGAVLVLHVAIYYPLLVALCATVIIVLAITPLRNSEADWTRA